MFSITQQELKWFILTLYCSKILLEVIGLENKPKLTKEILTELYINKDLNFKEIGKLLGYDNSWVRRKVIQFDIPLKSKGIELEEEQLRQMYIECSMSQKEIAKEIGRSQCYVRGKLIEFGIESRESGMAQAMKRGVKFNDKFFDEWSDNMAYVLGFIYADGSLTDYRLTIELSKHDEDFLKMLCDLLEFPHDKIYQKEIKKYNAKSVGISPSRRDMARRLMELGITENKTKTMKFPIDVIPKHLLPHFIRGYFDGDGSVGYYSKQLLVQFSCGSLDFSETLAEVLSNALDHQVKIGIDKRGSTNYSVRFHSTRLATKFYEYIYPGDCPCLHRKKEVFEKHMPILCF